MSRRPVSVETTSRLKAVLSAGIAAELPNLHQLCIDDIGAKGKRLKAERPAPYPKKKNAPPTQLAALVYNPQFAETKIGSDFLTLSGLGRHRSHAIDVTRRLLFNIPNKTPTDDEPHALQYPMLTRLRNLLQDARLSKDAQAVISAIGANGPTRDAEDLKLLWQAFSPPASKQGHLNMVMELITLLYRANEFFMPLAGDPTNDIRFSTWHGEGEDAKTYEYVWFQRLSAHLYVRLLRSFQSQYMIENYKDAVMHVHKLAGQAITADEWPL